MKKNHILTAVIAVAFVLIAVISFGMLYRCMFGELKGKLTIQTNSDKLVRFEVTDCTAFDQNLKKCRLTTKYYGDTADFANRAGYGLYCYTVNVYIDGENIPLEIQYMKANNRRKSTFSVDIFIEENMGQYDALVKTSPYGTDLEIKDIKSNPITIKISEV